MKVRNKLFILEFIILVITCAFYKGLFLGLLWVVLHEITHILVGVKYNVRITGMQIYIVGTKAEIYDIDKLKDKEKILLYAVGPLFNLLIAIIMFFLNGYINSDIIIESYKINLGLFIFNILPAYPLDGARIFEVVLGRRFLYKKTKNFVVTSSYIISIILTLIFFFTIYIHKSNVSLLIASILITYSTFLEKKNIMYILMGSLVNKTKWLRNREYIENKNISIYYKTTLVKAMSLVDRNRFNSFLILNEGLQVLGVVYEGELIEALKRYGNISFNEYLEYKNK